MITSATLNHEVTTAPVTEGRCGRYNLGQSSNDLADLLVTYMNHH
jgi:hypothetical protein